ncbi:hypothetical protein AB0G15_39615 [Streptosporangium sp. NPDC023825]|uniref:hypothetical protein n=1 Tax=Streptosporangium sp. NPDC023825 TaxID=3154909 RepID=UPI003419F6A3
MEQLSLHWKMVRAGSADLVLRFPRETIEVHTTYIGDGLGSVVQAAIDLRLGSSSATAFLPAEPAGTFLFFTGADEEAYLQVVQFTDMESESRRWSGGSLRWRGRVDVRAFIRSVVVMADDVLVRCGSTAAYSKAWGGITFPIRELETLRQGS